MQSSRLFPVLALLVVLFSACNKEAEMTEEGALVVPEIILANFTTQYPLATNVKWDMEGYAYEVDFMQDGVASSVVMDTTGTVLAIETAIAATDVPEAIITYLNTNYAGYTDMKAESLIEPANGSFFEIEIMHNGSAVELVFDVDGNFVRMSVPEVDDMVEEPMEAETAGQESEGDSTPSL